jgi:hypothetical protein
MTPVRRAYATPEALKRALEDRVRAAAQAAGMPIHRQRQLLLYDRLLGRLGAHFGEDVLTKGGVVLELRLERARTTRDVDVRLVGSPENLLGRLQDAVAQDFGDSLRFLLSELPEDEAAIEGDGMVYEGRRFRVEAQLAGKLYGARFGLDVAFGDTLTGQVDVVDGTDMLSFVDAPRSRIRLYPRETHVAEKLHALTLPRPRPNSRVKDLPDIALLAQSGPFEASTLSRALVQTFRFRGTHALPRTLPAPPEAWEAPYRTLAKENALAWPSLGDVTAAAEAFLNPLLDSSAGASWSPATWRWQA